MGAVFLVVCHICTIINRESFIHHLKKQCCEKRKKNSVKLRLKKLPSVRNQPKAIAECTVVLHMLWKIYLFDAKLWFCHFKKNTLQKKTPVVSNINTINSSSNITIQDLNCTEKYPTPQYFKSPHPYLRKIYNFQTLHYPTPQYCKSPHP